MEEREEEQEEGRSSPPGECAFRLSSFVLYISFRDLLSAVRGVEEKEKPCHDDRAPLGYEMALRSVGRGWETENL